MDLAHYETANTFCPGCGRKLGLVEDALPWCSWCLSWCCSLKCRRTHRCEEARRV